MDNSAHQTENNNYVDAMTPEEREAQSKIKVTYTTASTPVESTIYTMPSVRIAGEEYIRRIDHDNLLHTERQAAKKEWLRSETEKLEGMKMPHKDWTKDEHYKTCKDGCTYCCSAEGTRCGFNQALTTIVTRYKEELLELEKEV